MGYMDDVRRASGEISRLFTRAAKDPPKNEGEWKSVTADFGKAVMGYKETEAEHYATVIATAYLDELEWLDCGKHAVVHEATYIGSKDLEDFKRLLGKAEQGDVATLTHKGIKVSYEVRDIDG